MAKSKLTPLHIASVNPPASENRNVAKLLSAPGTRNWDKIRDMPTTAEDFPEKLKCIVEAHYESQDTPLLLSHLGLKVDREDLWPVDRGQRNLKRLILETCSPDLDVVWDKRSPAYIAVVTRDVREKVVRYIEQRFANDAPPIRLEDIAQPILLGFCIDVGDKPVYVRRTRPFRYEVGPIAPDRISDYVLVEPEYRKPGLRLDRPQQLPPDDRRDLENRIQKWATVHGLAIEQFSRWREEEKPVSSPEKNALDRLISAQPADVAQRLMIPADIAQILSKVR